MSKAAKCDRCGKYYDVDHITSEKVVSPDASHVFQELGLFYRDDVGIRHAAIQYELCPECRKSIKAWILYPQFKESDDWVECYKCKKLRYKGSGQK